MAAPSPATVIIACPACGTRYQVERETLGNGRLVQCAHCQTAWEAQVMGAALPPPAPPSDPDQLFDSTEEQTLDAAFVEEEQAVAAAAEESEARSVAEIAAAIAPKPKGPDRKALAAIASKRMRAFSRRQDSLSRSLPLGRLRRTARMTGFIALMVILGCGVTLRTQLVQQFPDLAGVYEAIGLGVNVIGLEFREVRTLQTLRDGSEVLVVNARIVSVSDRPVIVPPVVVALVNADGASIYEWSVSPEARDLEPGETVAIETQLTRPPTGAERVKLTFASGQAQPETVSAISPTSENPT